MVTQFSWAAIVDSGRFDWTCGQFPEFTEPDESYHGVVYSEAFWQCGVYYQGTGADDAGSGSTMTAQGAFYLNLGLETLPPRMAKHCENADAVAKYLAKHEKGCFCELSDAAGDKYHDLAQKYLPKGSSGVVAFDIKGGREAAVRFLIPAFGGHSGLAETRTAVLHPASSTHRQLTDEQPGCRWHHTQADSFFLRN